MSSEDPRTTDKFPADTELGSILGGTVNYVNGNIYT